MGSCAVPERCDVAQRRLSIDLLSPGQMGDRLHDPTVRIFDFDDNVPITRPGTPSIDSNRIKLRRVIR
jgi:hypothetical protein